VQHLVYSSVGGAERNTGIPRWESKWEVEKHIRQLALPATIFRPSAFMDMYYLDQMEIGILKGKLADFVRADKPYQTIATDDIGAFVALAFECPEQFMGKALEIAGSELTNAEAVKVFSRVLGKPVKYQRLPLLLARLVLGNEFYTMFRWFNDYGCKADIVALRRDYPQIHLQTLEEWLRKEGWDKRAKHIRAPKG